MSILWKVSARNSAYMLAAVLLTAGCSRHGQVSSNPQVQAASNGKKGNTVQDSAIATVNTANGRVNVQVVLQNSTPSTTFYFEPWQLFRDGDLNPSLLEVKLDGKDVDAIVPMVKRAPTADAELVPLAPGHTLHANIDIGKDYSFADGVHDHTVAYQAFVRTSLKNDDVAAITSLPITFKTSK